MKKKYLALGVGGAVGGLITYKMLSRAKTVSWEDFAEKIHHPENSHFAEVDGATVHYQEFGETSDPTLLLIHGYTASTYAWQTVAPRLAENGFHVVAADLLGFGFSEKPAAFDYTIGSQARMIVRLMNVLGIGRAVVAGSSYGGAIASTIALDYPERVEKLILVGAVCNDDARKHPILRLANVPGIGEIITLFLSDSKRFLRRRMRNTFAPEHHDLITEDRVEAIRAPLHAADAHRSLLATARSWDACRIQSDAHFIKHPTLLIWGDKDTVIPMSNGERLFETIPEARFVVFKNCGHVPQEENADLFVDLVTEFAADKSN